VSDIPVQPKTNHRALVAVVIGLGALFVIAVVATVVGVTLKLGSHAPSRAEALTLPRDARIVAIESQQGRLILHLRGPAGDEIDIVDTADGHLVARIRAGN